MEHKPTYELSTSMNEEIIEIIITGEVSEDCFEKLMKERNKNSLHITGN